MSDARSKKNETNNRLIYRTLTCNLQVFLCLSETSFEVVA